MAGMLIDVTRCTGCETCVAACVRENHLDPVLADRDKATVPDGLSENRFTTVIRLDESHFAKKACMHCEEPGCVRACLVGGLTIGANGNVEYDPDKCIGCRYCMLACPFHIPRYEWSATVPFMKKCEMCEDRLAQGQIPACAEACPHDAILYGEREFLIEQANLRFSENPGRYIDHIWGEHEFHGTNVLYISDVDLISLGWPALNTVSHSIPHHTETMLKATPFIGGSVLAGVSGLSWIIRRRMELMNGNSHDDKGGMEQ